MTVTTLTFIGSEDEVTSGIPKLVTISSNVPATIYFTIDGTTPSVDSSIYIDTIQVPTGMTSVTLKAFGVDNLDVAGPILSQVFSADTTNISVTRHVLGEGIIIDRGFFGPSDIDGFGADGNPNRFLDIEDIKLEFIHASSGFLNIEEGTEVEVNFPSPVDTAYPYDDNFVPFSTPEIGELFNPFARVILIDNRIENDINIIPRPNGSFSNAYIEFGGKRLLGGSNATYISGGLVKKFYDQKNGIIVSYYFDHNECRYVKNIQSLPQNVPTTAGVISSGIGMVFKWVDRGSQTGLIT